MKKFILLSVICLFLFGANGLFAQEVSSHLNDARLAYASGDLEGARFALQQAINAVDFAIGEEILKVLPPLMGELEVDASQDQIGVGNMGYAGLHLSRHYGGQNAPSVELSVIADSPMLAGINAMLSMPFMGGDSGQKKIRLNGYRGLLQQSDSGNGQVSWEMQIPFGSSLLSISFYGIADENSVMELAGTIPMDQLAGLIQ